MPKHQSHTFEPRPLTAKPLSVTPYDQTKAMPIPSRSGMGKLGGLGPKVSGGGMQSGGKRRQINRPGINPRRPQV